MKKLFVLVSALLLALSLVAGCGGGDQKKAEEKKPAAPAKTLLTVGTEPSFAPFEFPKKDSNEFTGFDIELVQALAKQMGYKECKIVNMGFDALIPALNAKTIDVAIAGMTITDERKKQVNFSDPYYKSGLIVMVTKDMEGVKSINDLKGKRIAVQIGTTGAMAAEKVEGAKVTHFNTNDLACIELQNKGADAVIGDLPVEQYFLRNGGDKYAKLVGDPLSAEDYGIATAKDNTQLVQGLNKALAELKKNGEYTKLYKQWFGEDPKL